VKRIQDKIKDLVEPQAFEQGGNFAEEPARALDAYRFTDLTSDLLARWLDVLADLPRTGGAALALAGARGVGKSHTLAVFGALAGSERLRQTVSDAHVATSAQRLSGRRYAVVRVERGTRPTLAGEMAAAFARVFGGSESQWAGGAAEMLSVAASRAFDERLVLVVDTAPARPARVARDDGPLLGELAVTARATGAFVALALDDDIAGADGANVALTATYQIDYLDPENLYRVAEQFVLRKRPQGRGTIRDIYQNLRASVPDFKWSEARFASLYPVHPLVAETAAGVRLYVPAFAFLPFAGVVAARAAARPALSLVLLDEVFDATEAELRKSPDLQEAFAAFDRLAAECIGHLPVMQRHQARLILKSLFVLSLDGRGATPRELCAALLLSDQQTDHGATAQVEETLARFAEAARGAGLRAAPEPGGHTRYRFRIDALDSSTHAETEINAQATKAAETGKSAADAHAAAEAADAEAVETPKTSEEIVEAEPVTARAAEPPPTLEQAEPEAQAPAQPLQTAPPPDILSETLNKETSAGPANLLEDLLGDLSPAAAAESAVPTPAVQAREEVAPVLNAPALDVPVPDAPASAASLAEQSFRDLFADDEFEELQLTPEGAGRIAEAAADAGRAENPSASAAPFETTSPGAGELSEWARLLTGDASLASLAEPEGREAVRAALARWLDTWRALSLRQKFEALPDNFATTRVWKVEAGVGKTFGRAGAAVEAALAGKISLEEALGRVGAAFRHSPDIFDARARDLTDLTELVEGFGRRERLRAYLAAAEGTGIDEIETARRELFNIAGDPSGLLDAGRRARFERLWREFHARYTEHYAAAHDKTVGAGSTPEALQLFKRGARWREFESLARLPVVSARVWRQAADALRRAELSRCELPVRRLLESRPACACRFRLAHAAELARLPQELEALTERGLEVYRRTLLMLSGHLAIALDAIARRESDEEAARRARSLSTAFAQGRAPERFTRRDVRLLERAFERMAAPPPVRVAAPNGDAGLLTRDELRARFTQWLDELPERPVLIELVSRNESHAP
jgi:hypothetical protein